MTYSTLGATHHAQEDVAIAAKIPTCRSSRHAIRPKPRLRRAGARRMNGAQFICGWARLANQISRRSAGGVGIWQAAAAVPGRRRLLLSYGPIMKRALAVADRFEAVGKGAAIFSAHTLKPLDREALISILRDYSDVVVIEECAPNGSLAMRVRELGVDRGGSSTAPHLHFARCLYSLLRLARRYPRCARARDRKNLRGTQSVLITDKESADGKPG